MQAPHIPHLVADDDAANRRLTQEQLQLLGYEAETVSDGEQALEAVQQGVYDLILMDLDMLGLDGLGATRAIRTLGTQSTNYFSYSHYCF